MNWFNVLIAVVISWASCNCLRLARHKSRSWRMSQQTEAASPVIIGEAVSPVIIGGGPAGLTCAIMLARRGGVGNIRVFERLPGYPRSDDSALWENERSYIIGINGRFLCRYRLPPEYLLNSFNSCLCSSIDLHRGQNVLKWIGAMERVEKNSATVLGNFSSSLIYLVTVSTLLRTLIYAL